MRKGITTFLGILLVIFLIVSGLKSLYNSVFDDFKAEGWTHSQSIEKSRQRGILVMELMADPTEPAMKSGTIKFEQVWIEEQSLTTHRFAWFPYEQRTGRFVLYCVNSHDKNVEPIMLYEKNVGASWGYVSSRDYEFMYIILDRYQLSELRFPTDYNANSKTKYIRFIRKQ